MSTVLRDMEFERLRARALKAEGQRDALLAAAKAVLASAAPRQAWHPSMWKAWDQVREAIRLTETEFKL